MGGAGIFTDAGKWLAAAWALSLARVRASANGLEIMAVSGAVVRKAVGFSA